MADPASFDGNPKGLHHSVHAGLTAVSAAVAFLLLGNVGDHAVGREEETRDGGGVLESAARNLSRINDAALEEVGVLARTDVVAVRSGRLLDVGDHESSLLAGVVHKLAQGSLDRAGDDARTDSLVAFELEGDFAAFFLC